MCVLTRDSVVETAGLVGRLARGRRLERVATCPRFEKLESRLESVVDVQMLCCGREKKGICRLIFLACALRQLLGEA